MTVAGPGPSSTKYWQSAALASLAAGSYVAAFYVVGNLTMLAPASIALLVPVLILPVVLAVLATVGLLTLANLSRYAGFATAFVCGVYLTVALRASVFDSETVSAVREQLHGVGWLAAHALYFLGSATLIGLLFRKNTGKLAAVLAAMTVAAILIGARELAGSSISRDEDPAVVNVELDRKPNVYFILADSFASFSYMDDKGIDLTDFKRRLGERGFRLYNDSFSNYHATNDSMLSMLSMKHHYYQASKKLSEVSSTARQIIGGENDLVRLLKNNGYATQYIHQADYLLLHGCTADYCFPAPSGFAGATSVMAEVIPGVLAQGADFGMLPLDSVREAVSTQLAIGEASTGPRFNYIHFFAPMHASNRLVGQCDEELELEGYADRVVATAETLGSVVDEIIRSDGDAVIVLSGDHGPFLANQCGRETDIGTIEEYRDRVSALSAVRWPSEYDGRFDERIRTNVNLFRYVLASLVDGSTDGVGGHVPDDVFVHGSAQVLQVIKDGSPTFPAVRLSTQDLESLSAAAGSHR
jgi:hypothetical protein